MKPLILALFLTGCTTTITSPATGVQYTGKISGEGISILAVPPFWTWAVELYKSFR